VTGANRSADVQVAEGVSFPMQNLRGCGQHEVVADRLADRNAELAEIA
jgi:hypothetical protein